MEHLELMRLCNFALADLCEQLIEFLLCDFGNTLLHDIVDGDLVVPILLQEVALYLGCVQPVHSLLDCLGYFRDRLCYA